MSKTNLNKHLVLVTLLFSPFLYFISKSENLHQIKVLSSLNGLPSDEVKHIYQDNEGYIWIATNDGLCRYDGYQTKIYKSNLYTPDLLSGNKINALAEDQNSNLWIGTTKGLNVLNKITGEIKKIGHDKLGHIHIEVIIVTKKNDVWIGTGNGIYIFKPITNTFEFYDNASTNYKLRGNDIKTFFEDHRGNIWIGTWNEGVTRYDVDSQTFNPYPHINPSNSAHTIFEDNNHNIWVGSWGHGLFRLENPYDIENVKYINYLHDKNNRNSLVDNIVYALSQDTVSNAIWVGTRSGLSILNNIDDPFSFTNHLPYESDLLPYNELNAIIRDNSGLMWLGTLGGGVAVVDTRKSLFEMNRLDEVKDKISSNSVRSLYIDNKNLIWMGIGSYGLVTYDRERNHYTYFEDHPDFKETPIYSSVYYVLQSKKTNAYWIGTHGQGIIIYNPTLPSGRVKNITYEAGLNSNLIYSLKEDVNGNMWVGTSEGIYIYNTKNEEAISYPYLGHMVDDQKHYMITCIEEEEDNVMWLASAENGIFKVRKSPELLEILELNHYNTINGKLNNNNVQYIYKDKKRQIWVGSKGGGLSLYDREKDIFVSVQQKYNIPGDIVNSIAEDNSGNLWLGTNEGLAVLKFSSPPDSKEIVSVRHYTISDGLQNNFFNRNAVFRARSGELFFGGHNGYNYFRPELLHEKPHEYPVVITDIKIFNKSLETIDEKLRKKISPHAAGYTNMINLPYHYNNFNIEFATLNYSNSMQNKYAFMLEGFDKEWQYTDASRRFAYYNNLKSGKYTFHLKSSNGNGIWNETPITLQMTVNPPWWLTGWAFLIYAVLLTTILFVSVKIMNIKISLQNAIKLKDIEKQKTEELNQAKLQFFTNISHEFLTPLTILSASVDELKIISPKHGDYYETMSDNINRLIRLLQQILEFRKAETGNLKLKVSEGDIARFIKQRVESFKPLLKKNKMHFSLLCDPESIQGYFDHDKMDKILSNLLSNASKYNKPGGFIQVNVNYISESKQVVIAVKDNGEGISPNSIKGLFKRFYEGDYRRFNTIGTGIGLSLTKDLVELHKGKISVESEVGKGTTFFIEIPLNRERYSADEIEKYVYPPKEEAVIENTGKKTDVEKQEEPKEHTILLVEDNDELLQLMVKMLKRKYNIFTATNGKEGVKVLESEYIDLTISDIMMPEMNGIEFCRHVKSNFETSHVPIILLTAKNKEEDKIEAYDAGADSFISKPFNLNVLYSKISNLLKSRERANREFKKQFVFEPQTMSITSIDEDFLKNAVNCVHEHMEDPEFDQQLFADALGTSKSTLYKKLKSLTGLNSSSFIRSIRLKTACKIIEEKKKIRISELAYAVGFNDPKYFSSCFKKEYGLKPSEYLDKILEEEKKGNNNGGEQVV